MQVGGCFVYRLPVSKGTKPQTCARSASNIRTRPFNLCLSPAGAWGRGRVIALDIRQGEVCFVAVVPVEGGEPYWVNPENIGYIYPMHHELNRDIDEYDV
jgi:hypothetical protein